MPIEDDNEPKDISSQDKLLVNGAMDAITEIIWPLF
jgi:hypothetical protein